MIRSQTRHGLPVDVPETEAEDPGGKFSIDELPSARGYYQANGYVVFRGLLPLDDCELTRSLWAREVKPFGGHIYRQATARAERNVLGDRGWVMNPILNLQSLDPWSFPRLRAHAVERVLTAENLVRAFTALLGERPKIVQSMYFEGNSATWEHQDSYYLDSENIGSMSAAWIALEDISASAGRFFVCPGSHRIDLGGHNVENNIADSHDKYVLGVVAEIRRRNLEIRAPKLNAGDVLFWNARTIHGSLKSDRPTASRSSITCHAIADSDRFLQMQTRLRNITGDAINGATVWRPKDQARLKNRLVLFCEANFPGPFYFLKARAIRHLVKRKAP